MKEQPARNLSLLIIGIEFLFMYWTVYMTDLERLLNFLRIGELDSNLFIVIGIFTAFGLLILLSVFYKPVYHILAFFETVLFVVLYSSFPKNSGETVLIAIFALFPYLIYYGCVIMQREHKQK